MEKSVYSQNMMPNDQLGEIQETKEVFLVHFSNQFDPQPLDQETLLQAIKNSYSSSTSNEEKVQAARYITEAECTFTVKFLEIIVSLVNEHLTNILRAREHFDHSSEETVLTLELLLLLKNAIWRQIRVKNESANSGEFKINEKTKEYLKMFTLEILKGDPDWQLPTNFFLQFVEISKTLAANSPNGWEGLDEYLQSGMKYAMGGNYVGFNSFQRFISLYTDAMRVQAGRFGKARDQFIENLGEYIEQIKKLSEITKVELISPFENGFGTEMSSLLVDQSNTIQSPYPNCLKVCKKYDRLLLLIVSSALIDDDKIMYSNDTWICLVSIISEFTGKVEALWGVVQKLLDEKLAIENSGVNNGQSEQLEDIIDGFYDYMKTLVKHLYKILNKNIFIFESCYQGYLNTLFTVLFKYNKSNMLNKELEEESDDKNISNGKLLEITVSSIIMSIKKCKQISVKMEKRESTKWLKIHSHQQISLSLKEKEIMEAFSFMFTEDNIRILLSYLALTNFPTEAEEGLMEIMARDFFSTTHTWLWDCLFALVQESGLLHYLTQIYIALPILEENKGKMEVQVHEALLKIVGLLPNLYHTQKIPEDFEKVEFSVVLNYVEGQIENYQNGDWQRDKYLQSYCLLLRKLKNEFGGSIMQYFMKVVQGLIDVDLSIVSKGEVIATIEVLLCTIVNMKNQYSQVETEQAREELEALTIIDFSELLSQLYEIWLTTCLDLLSMSQTANAWSWITLLTFITENWQDREDSSIYHNYLENKILFKLYSAWPFDITTCINDFLIVLIEKLNWQVSNSVIQLLGTKIQAEGQGEYGEVLEIWAKLVRGVSNIQAYEQLVIFLDSNFETVKRWTESWVIEHKSVSKHVSQSETPITLLLAYLSPHFTLPDAQQLRLLLEAILSLLLKFTAKLFEDKLANAEFKIDDGQFGFDFDMELAELASIFAVSKAAFTSDSYFYAIFESDEERVMNTLKNLQIQNSVESNEQTESMQPLANSFLKLANLGLLVGDIDFTEFHDAQEFIQEWVRAIKVSTKEQYRLLGTVAFITLAGKMSFRIESSSESDYNWIESLKAAISTTCSELEIEPSDIDSILNNSENWKNFKDACVQAIEGFINDHTCL